MRDFVASQDVRKVIQVVRLNRDPGTVTPLKTPHWCGVTISRRAEVFAAACWWVQESVVGTGGCSAKPAQPLGVLANLLPRHQLRDVYLTARLWFVTAT